eukprot:3619726-Rhodomonas_salina.1
MAPGVAGKLPGPAPGVGGTYWGVCGTLSLPPGEVGMARGFSVFRLRASGFSVSRVDCCWPETSGCAKLISAE